MSNKTEVTSGTIRFHKKVLTDIQLTPNGYMFMGHSLGDFGFIHEWKVGPYPRIATGLVDFYDNE